MISYQKLANVAGVATICILLLLVFVLFASNANMRYQIESHNQQDRDQQIAGINGLEEGAIVSCLLSQQPAIIADSNGNVRVINPAAELLLQVDSSSHGNTVDVLLRRRSSHHYRCTEINDLYYLFTIDAKPFYGSEPIGQIGKSIGSAAK